MNFETAKQICYGHDRFAQGARDIQESPPFAVCENPKCGDEIGRGQSYMEYDGQIFCDRICLVEGIGAEEKYAPGEDEE